ncbi:MAG: glycosyltransferase family 2 protein [Gaiellaceae bacterium]
MKLAMTLLARNEADLVEANVAFHLNAGADLVIATDNRSDDGTTEILESFARDGHLHLIREEGTDMRQGKWVTRMARLAAREHGADWVIHGDADEFYWPRGGTLKEVLAGIPPPYGSVRTFVRTFLLRPGGEELPFFERMTVRLSTPAPIHDPASIFRPGSKLIHRAHPDVVVGDGTHALHGASLPRLPGHHPIEMLHFPFRTTEQAGQKFVRAFGAWTQNPTRPPPHYYAKAYSAIGEGRVDEFIASLTCSDDVLERGLEDGTLVLDTRLRNALGLLRADGDEGRRFRLPSSVPRLAFPHPDLADDARYAAEAAALDEAEVVRLRRRMDAVAEHMSRLDSRHGRAWSTRDAELDASGVLGGG